MDKAELAKLEGEAKYEALNSIINECSHIVFFGGAGVSTESGIPDFRSKDGLYNQHDVQFDMFEPEYLLSHDCLMRQSEVFYEFYRQKMDARQCEPNSAHLKLAEMEEKGKLDGIITQNIDGLHQKAGSKVVYEIHGTTMMSYCLECGKEFDEDFLFEAKEAVPKCPKCGGMVRPDVTLYGEMLPESAWRGAEKLVRNADCLIIGGTSLAVYPAASLIDYFRGKYLIIVNKQPTDRDRDADLCFPESIGHVFSKIKL